MKETTYMSDLVEPEASIIAIEDIRSGSFVIFTSDERTHVRAYNQEPDIIRSLIAGVSNGIKAGENVAQGERVIVKKGSAIVSNDDFMAILDGSSKTQS